MTRHENGSTDPFTVTSIPAGRRDFIFDPSQPEDGTGPGAALFREKEGEAVRRACETRTAWLDNVGRQLGRRGTALSRITASREVKRLCVPGRASVTARFHEDGLPGLTATGQFLRFGGSRKDKQVQPQAIKRAGAGT